MFVFLRLASGLLFIGAILFGAGFAAMNEGVVSSEPTKRSVNAFGLGKSSLYLSVLAGVLSCFLNVDYPMEEAMQYTMELFIVFSAILLLAWACTAVASLIVLIRRKGKERALETALRKVQSTALQGLFLTALLAWMFS